MVSREALVDVPVLPPEQQTVNNAASSADSKVGAPSSAQPQSTEFNLVVEIADGTDRAISTDANAPAATTVQSVPVDQASTS